VLDGPIDPPPGVEINDPDGISASAVEGDTVTPERGAERWESAF